MCVAFHSLTVITKSSCCCFSWPSCSTEALYASVNDCLQSFASIDSSVLFELRHKGVPTMIFRADSQPSCERYVIFATISEVVINSVRFLCLRSFLLTVI